MSAKKIELLVELLRSALNDKPNRQQFITQFQNQVWNGGEESLDTAEGEIVRDLAYDLDYYEPDPVLRSESGSYFDEERLESLIGKALEDLGVGSTNRNPL